MFRRKSLTTIAGRCKRFASSGPSCVEVRIPVPWGHIAGKWWGPTDQRPILTTHGWQDNCGSFDLLIPLLPRNLSYLTIDSTGHGLSSKLPQGMFYYNTNAVILIKRLKDFFKWDKISLMGHSVGAFSAYMYGFLYPSTVDFIVCIDGFHSWMARNPVEKCSLTIDGFLKYDAHNSSGVEPPSFTFEELAVKMRQGSQNSVDLDKAKHILERNVKPSVNNPGKFYVSRDRRLKCGSLNMWPKEEVVVAAARVNFPLFVSRTEKTPFFRDHQFFPEVYAQLKRSCPDFELHDVRGTHHGHLNHPEIYKDIIPNFLNKFATGNRSQAPIINQIGRNSKTLFTIILKMEQTMPIFLNF